MLVLGLTLTAGALLSRRMFYGNDDLLEFTAARTGGLSWSYLSLNVFEHFAPYNRLMHYVVLRFSDLSPDLGLPLVLAPYAALLAAALWLMTELRLSAPRRVAALILIGLSAPMTESAIWFDAGNHILPAIAVTLAICAAHVRGVRTRAARWHVLALALFVLGQLTQERPIFALPLLVLVDVLLLWRDLPWAERLRRLWALRAPLLALTVAAAAIAVALRTYVVIDRLSTPSWAITGRMMLSSLTNYAVPSLVNLPRPAPAGLSGQLVVLGVVALVGLVLALARRGNAGPVLFCAAVFLMYYGFLKLSPLLTQGTLEINAERLNYAVYVTVPAVIALAHLRAPRRARADAPRERAGTRHPRLRRALQVGLCLSLAGYLAGHQQQLPEPAVGGDDRRPRLPRHRSRRCPRLGGPRPHPLPPQRSARHGDVVERAAGAARGPAPADRPALRTARGREPVRVDRRPRRHAPRGPRRRPPPGQGARRRLRSASGGLSRTATVAFPPVSGGALFCSCGIGPPRTSRCSPARTGSPTRCRGWAPSGSPPARTPG